MKKLLIILILSLSACHIPDKKEREMRKAKSIVIDYLNKSGKHNLIFDAEHSFYRSGKNNFGFWTTKKLNGINGGPPFEVNEEYMIKLDTNLTKVISCISLTD